LLIIDITWDLIIHIIRLIILIHAWSIKLASILFNSCMAHIFLNLFFFISITVLFFIQVRFFNSIETRGLIICVVSIINISIKNISTGYSRLLLFLRLLLLLLCSMGRLKIFLFLLELNKCLSLLFNIFWIIPIIPIWRYWSTTLLISWGLFSTNCSSQSIFSRLISRYWFYIHWLTLI